MQIQLLVVICGVILLTMLNRESVAVKSPSTKTPKSNRKKSKWQSNTTDTNKMGQSVKLLKQLLKNYDWRIRPRGRNVSADGCDPVIITVNLFLRTISKVDDVNMEYSAHFTFREEWYDERLKFNTNELGLKQIILPSNAMVWGPDTFFQNEKEGKFHTIDKPNVMTRIQGSGDVLYSVRLTLMMSCPMNLQNYPMDTQECFIDLASYAYTEEDIKYVWKTSSPIQIKAGLHSSLPSFTLTDVMTTVCTSKTNTGSYSCLRTVLILKREFSYYLLQLYIPSFMLVGVSWVSFWLDKDSVPARVTLGVTTLLTMTTQASGINAKLPPVSYTKAIDVWIGVCLAFIFGALLEFALVNYAANRVLHEKLKKPRSSGQSLLGEMAKWETLTAVIEQYRKNRERSSHNGYGYGSQANHYEREILTFPPLEDFPAVHRKTTRRSSTFLTRFRTKYDTSKKIDVISRCLFPLAFCIFNVAYWTIYLIPYLRVRVNVQLF